MKVSGYVISLILAVMVIASMVVFAGASGALFINVPAVMVVVLFPLVLLRAGFSFTEMRAYFRLALGGHSPQGTVQVKGAAAEEVISAAELKRGVLFFNALRGYLLGAGFIGGLVGTITMLADLSDTSTVGFGAALVLLTILYALVFSAVLVLPLRTSLEKRLAGVQTQAASKGR